MSLKNGLHFLNHENYWRKRETFEGRKHKNFSLETEERLLYSSVLFVYPMDIACFVKGYLLICYLIA
jgi:hypothetical protein